MQNKVVPGHIFSSGCSRFPSVIIPPILYRHQLPHHPPPSAVTGRQETNVQVVHRICSVKFRVWPSRNAVDIETGATCLGTNAFHCFQLRDYGFSGWIVPCSNVSALSTHIAPCTQPQTKKITCRYIWEAGVSNKDVKTMPCATMFSENVSSFSSCGKI
jgi:hypothetical protein